MVTKSIPETPLGKLMYYIDELLLMLQQSFPDDRDLHFYHDKFAAGRKANPRLVAEMMAQELLPYEKQIQAKDESFFMNMKVDAGNDELRLIEKIKGLWSTGFSQTTKDSIWKYCAVYLKLLHVLGFVSET
ncbi:MAG: hypothetical protein ACYCOU_08285 [Sulfobacillus sp.]